MTPEEWAEKFTPHYGIGMVSGATPEQVKAAVAMANAARPLEVMATAEAIRAAVAEEREACARLVEQLSRLPSAVASLPDMRVSDTDIAAAIRARSDP